MLKKNINGTGRVIRFVIAIILVGYAVWAKSWVAGLLGVFTLFESMMSWCILYQLIGKNSCPIDKS